MLYAFAYCINIIIKEITMKINIKKTLAATLAICAMTSGAVIPGAGTSLLAPKAVTASAADQFFQDGKYSFCIEDGKTLISGYSGNENVLVLPKELRANNRTYQINGIRYSAFYQNYYLTDVTIPEGYTLIGAGAFQECKNLKNVKFSSTITQIGGAAFYKCSGLEGISNINNYGNYEIGNNAFYGCTNLRKINGSNEVRYSNNDVYLNHDHFVKKYFKADETVGFIQDYVNEKAAAVVAQVRAAHPGCTQLLLAKLLRDWVIDNGISARTKWIRQNPNKTYTDQIKDQEEERPEYHDDTAIFFGGVGVCEGYSKTLRKLYLAAGFDCEIVRGKVTVTDINGFEDTKYHVWNVVKLDGSWYNVDAYWDDDDSSAKHTDWYLLSDTEIKNREARQNHSYSGLYHDKIAVRTNGPFYENIEDDLFLYNCYYSVGDVNKDGYVTREDAEQLGVGLGYGGRISTVNSDMNYDGAVTLEDLYILRSIVGY
jgi:hypothetical protein